MFEIGREKEPENFAWQRATWENKLGYAKRLPKQEEGWKKWHFSLELPSDVDPNSVKLGYSGYEGSERWGVYNVSYRLRDSLKWTLAEVVEKTSQDNKLGQFSAYVEGYFDEHIAQAVTSESQILEL